MEFNFKEVDSKRNDRSYLGIRVNTAHIALSIKTAKLFKENLVAHVKVHVDKQNKAILIKKVKPEVDKSIHVAWTTINVNLYKLEGMPTGRYLLKEQNDKEFIFVYESK